MDKTLSHLYVFAENLQATRGILQAGTLKMPCALGRGGLTEHKREGDGATPLGTWPLREIYYRADQVAAPETSLKQTIIEPDDGWCDDETDAHYNLPVKLPFAPSYEKMWRDDHLYNLVVPLGYNDAPPVIGHGSAIFFHLAHEDYRSTEGCVSIAHDDMMNVLRHCGPQTSMRIELQAI